jgi:hypothetical protein
MVGYNEIIALVNKEMHLEQKVIFHRGRAQRNVLIPVEINGFVYNSSGDNLQL